MSELKSYYLFKKLSNDRLSLIFNGEVNDKITDGIIRLTDFNVNSLEDLSKMRNRVNFIMVECFQNLVRHGKPDDSDGLNDSTLFSTRVVGQANYISSINLIDANRANMLKDKLKQLNTLEKDKLKALYFEILENRQFSEKGGAGLGLIEIARKAGQPIDHSIESINEKFYNFYLSLKLASREDLMQREHGETLRFTRQFDDEIKNSNILMVYKGDFSKESILPIINIIQERMYSPDESSRGKSLYSILVELLQNVSRHALDTQNKEGLFMITFHDNTYTISAGNMVTTETKAILVEKIESLNKLNNYELKDLYKKTLKEGMFSEKGGGGLGLIEIARESSGPLGYDFDDTDNNLSFFTLNVTF